MAKVTFYPLGNADCCQITLDNGRKILFDYANTRDPEADDDKRAELDKKLREDLDEADRDSFDVVAFTHLDKDHYQRASEFFFLEHDKKYQEGDRVKIDVLWVPAAVIIETGVEDDEGKIIRAEARFRLKQGKGIRVFSRPDKMKDWLENNGLKLEDRKALITNAGQLAPEFTIDEDGVEFFIHSPFSRTGADGKAEDRNDSSIVAQATFSCEGTETKVILAADATNEVLTDIVTQTKKHKNEVRLEWDVYKLPHHCSYLSLGPEKGKDKTEPGKEVKWLFEEQGQEVSTIVSTSEPIPVKGSAEDKDDNPPHRQAANYYKEVQSGHGGEFKVTMEHPTKDSPAPLEIEIGVTKATILKRAISATVVATGRQAPRAG